MNAKAVLLQIQTDLLAKGIELETESLRAKSAIIIAETTSESWITRTWRPIAMLSLLAAVLLYWLGWAAESIPLSIVNRMFSLVQLGLGGYIVSRGAEKIVPGIIKSLKQKEQT